MTPRKPAPPAPPAPRVTLTDHDGQLVAEYPWKTYRFMFSDGATLDVVAIRDDSDLREAMLRVHFGKTVKDPKDGRIEGVAIVGERKSAENSPRSKRVVKRGTAPVSDRSGRADS